MPPPTTPVTSSMPWRRPRALDMMERERVRPLPCTLCPTVVYVTRFSLFWESKTPESNPLWSCGVCRVGEDVDEEDGRGRGREEETRDPRQQTPLLDRQPLPHPFPFPLTFPFCGWAYLRQSCCVAVHQTRCGQELTASRLPHTQ
jgi:hypothetical protein